MVAAATAATEAAHGDRFDLAGPIRLAAPMSFGIKVLGAPLAAFMAEHPAVEIELTLSDARHDLIAEGFDLALRVASLDDSSLLARTIAPIPTSVIASPAYLDRHGTPRHPLELAGHRLAGYGHREKARPLRFHREGERGDDRSGRPAVHEQRRCDRADAGRGGRHRGAAALHHRRRTARRQARSDPDRLVAAAGPSAPVVAAVAPPPGAGCGPCPTISPTR